MRIRPNDMSFPTMPPAYGPGIHGSELDAAWHDIKNELPPTLRSQFAEQYREDNAPPSSASSGRVRRRASGAAEDMTGGSAKEAEDATMATRDLYEIAMLTTGRWGVLSLPDRQTRSAFPSGAGFEPQKTKGVFTDTQYKPSQYMNFWDRMAALETLLEARKKSVTQKYDAKKAVRRPWLDSLEEMIDAVKFLREQQGLPANKRSIFKSFIGSRGSVQFLPLGTEITVLSVNGNSKLPYIAYSELPMSTCPGAGACGVTKKDASSGSVVGWCYSFKAWRYPGAFKRQWLNTLANYADREFTILQNNGDDPTDGVDRYWPRIEAAMRSGQSRPWMQYVCSLVMREAAKIVYNDVQEGKLANIENGGRTVFFRLFVDGDIGQPDGIWSWMEEIKLMGSRQFIADAASITGSKEKRMDPRTMAPVQTYGYSKCWMEFVALDRKFRGYSWPENYTVNMSSASTYDGDPVIEPAMRNLPISRGRFNAIDFRQYLSSLKNITPNDIQMPEVPPLPGVTVQQLRGIVSVEGIAYERDEKGNVKLGPKGVPVIEDATAAAARLLDEYFGIRLLDARGRDITRRMVRSDISPLRDAPKAAKAKKKQPKKPESFLPEDAEARQAYFNAFASASELAIRKRTLNIALENMLTDPALAGRVKREIARDEGFVDVDEMLNDIEDSYQKSLVKYQKDLEKFEEKMRLGTASEKDRPSVPERETPSFEKESRQEKKLVALLVHAIFVASRNSQSGSCPLVCGNCADITIEDADEVYGAQEKFADFAARTGAVHRCASRAATAAYVPPEGKRLPKGIEVDREGFAKTYRRPRDGKTGLVVVTGYYGAEIFIGLH